MLQLPIQRIRGVITICLQQLRSPYERWHLCSDRHTNECNKQSLWEVRQSTSGLPSVPNQLMNKQLKKKKYSNEFSLNHASHNGKVQKSIAFQKYIYIGQRQDKLLILVISNHTYKLKCIMTGPVSIQIYAEAQCMIGMCAKKVTIWGIERTDSPYTRPRENGRAGIKWQISKNIICTNECFIYELFSMG